MTMMMMKKMIMMMMILTRDWWLFRCIFQWEHQGMEDGRGPDQTGKTLRGTINLSKQTVRERYMARRP
jgi:hypothetical protein